MKASENVAKIDILPYFHSIYFTISVVFRQYAFRPAPGRSAPQESQARGGKNGCLDTIFRLYERTKQAEEAVRLLRPDFGVLLTNIRLVREPWLIYRPLKLSPGMPAGLVWLENRREDALLRLTERIAALPDGLWRK